MWALFLQRCSTDLPLCSSDIANNKSNQLAAGNVETNEEQIYQAARSHLLWFASTELIVTFGGMCRSGSNLACGIGFPSQRRYTVASTQKHKSRFRPGSRCMIFAVLRDKCHTAQCEMGRSLIYCVLHCVFEHAVNRGNNINLSNAPDIGMQPPQVANKVPVSQKLYIDYATETLWLPLQDKWSTSLSLTHGITEEHSSPVGGSNASKDYLCTKKSVMETRPHRLSSRAEFLIFFYFPEGSFLITTAL